MEQKKIYVVGMAMNLDRDGEDAVMHDEDFDHFAYTDYEQAKEAFAIATKSMVGNAISLDDMLKVVEPFVKEGHQVSIRYGDKAKAVRFQEFDHMPDMDIKDGPIDPDYFREEETIEYDGGDE